MMCKRYCLLTGLCFYLITGFAQKKVEGVRLIPVAEGWASNSVNTVSFRKNSLTSFRDTQYIAFYNQHRFVVIGKRKITDTAWNIHTTNYQGKVADAHNSISIAVDGEGYLHMAWDHHNNPLRYVKSVTPYSFILTDKMPMTGKLENKVSYPEFYNLPNGDLLFFYRDGGSGNGNLVINKYLTAEKKWMQLHSNLIDGENKRNAYWQSCTDKNGVIHLSWVWRESPDVASNHDLCYARSKDGGITWEKSTGEKYQLPITAASAEYAYRIPPKSELINQTSMTTDEKGAPFIATYWRNEGSTIPTYRVIYLSKKDWQVATLSTRQTPFSISGMGSKRIPIARPQILVKGSGNKASVIVVFRDEERGNKVSVAMASKMKKGKWKVLDLTQTSVGSWEPSFDISQWNDKKTLYLFVQNVEQVDQEGKANLPPQMVNVLEWKPKKL
jgi:hypothetical protein